jgi:hypothetical protein
MTPPIDESTSQFLEAAADDLQRQLRFVGVLERIEVAPWPAGTSLVATIRVGHRMVDLQGFGDNLVAALADLQRHLAEPALIASWLNLYDSLLPTER